MKREKIIVRTGVIGIIANVLLSLFKALVGIFSGSIAILLDAVNNLSDALSSVITIVSTKLAGRKPDKRHPFGHGRLEYISAGLIAIIVLYAGFTALTESVKKMFVPAPADYNALGLVIIVLATAVKVFLGIYVSNIGKKLNSEPLIASGKDALLDAVISASTLFAAIIYMIWGLSLEAWLGAVISLVIIRSGLELLRNSVSLILGKRVEGDLARTVRQTILSFPEVSGVYDLILHNYGPERYIGSVHIELPGEYTVRELDILERNIAETVYEKTGVALTGIGVYAQSDGSDLSNRIFADVREAVSDMPAVLQLHGFSCDETAREIRFDVVIDYNADDRTEIFEKIAERVRRRYPNYTVLPTLDADSADF